VHVPVEEGDECGFRNPKNVKSALWQFSTNKLVKNYKHPLEEQIKEYHNSVWRKALLHDDKPEVCRSGSLIPQNIVTAIGAANI
jgi:hypothetical protein